MKFLASSNFEDSAQMKNRKNYYSTEFYSTNFTEFKFHEFKERNGIFLL